MTKISLTSALFVALTPVCGVITVLTGASSEGLMISLVIIFGTLVVVSIHLLLVEKTFPPLSSQEEDIRPKYESLYIPGIRNFDGTYGPKVP